jgi:hypothetical protein
MNFLKWFSWLQWLLLGFFLLVFAGIIGVGFGYLNGETELKTSVSRSIAIDIKTQFDLGMEDYKAGNYELARQRFEYVLQQDPDYSKGLEMLSETIHRLYEQVNDSGIQVTATFIPSATPSPTPDTREIDELVFVAQTQLMNEDWKNLVITIISLRDINPLYRVSEIDRALYLALYFGGIDKILEDGDLEGGLYDLSLAEQFAPLDSQASIYQEWARLYQIGMSFWGVYPDQSAYYFSQLAYAAPYLRDLSGVYAFTRYRLALIQYGDQLAQAEDWCSAIEQYNLAQSLYEDQSLISTIINVNEQCQLSIATYTPTPTITFTPTITPTITPTLGGLTSTPEFTPTLSATPEASFTPSLTSTMTPTEVTTPEQSPTSTLTNTQTSTPTPTPTSEVASPTASPTITPIYTETVEETLPPEPTATPTPTSIPESP